MSDVCFWNWTYGNCATASFSRLVVMYPSSRMRRNTPFARTRQSGVPSVSFLPINGEYELGRWGNPARIADSTNVKSFTGLLKYTSDAAPTPAAVPPYGASFKYISKIWSLLNRFSIASDNTNSFNFRVTVRSELNNTVLTNCCVSVEPPTTRCFTIMFQIIRSGVSG